METSKQQSQCVQVCGLYFLLTYRNASTTNQKSACSAYLYLGQVQQHTDISLIQMRDHYLIAILYKMLGWIL